VWQPVFEPTLILGLGFALGVLAVLAYVRSLRDSKIRSVWFLLMRLASIALLTALLMGPSELPDRVSSEAPPRLYLALDTSGSMETEDVGGKGRLAYLLEHWLSRAQIATLEESFDVRLVGFNDQPRATPITRLYDGAAALIGGQTTRYGAALKDTLSRLPMSKESGVNLIVMGDGHETDEQPLGSVASMAQGRGVKIHAVSVGGANPPPDIAVVATPRQDYLLPDEQGELLVRVYRSGAAAGSASVRIEKPDGESETHSVPFKGRGEASLIVPVRHEEAGRHEYRVSVTAAPNETATGNNAHTAFIDVTRERMRVLILEGEPYWDTKFLAQALRTDNRIELDHIAQINPKKRQNIVTRGGNDEGSSGSRLTLPGGVEELAAYDAIILGRGVEHLLSTGVIGNLEDYVAEAGGNLIFARGLAYDPNTAAGQDARNALSVVEPVVWGYGVMNHLPVRLTRAGASNPCFAFSGVGESPAGVVADMPEMESLVVVDSVKPGATVLARVGEAGAASEGVDDAAPPAMVTMPFGRGRVFAVLGEGLWRWSFLPPEKSELRGAFESFWSNTVRWMVMGGAFEPGSEVALELGRSSLRAGDEQTVELTTKKAPSEQPRMWVTGPDGSEREVGLRRVAGMATSYRATFKPDTEGGVAQGVWRVRVEAPGLEPAKLDEAFSVYDLDLERLRAGARPGVLQGLADATGGMYFQAEERVDLAARLERLRVASLVPPKPIYIWDQPWILVGLLAWVGLEWLGRRKAGWL
jgi:hypothetical protein